jgi:polyisoprenoid-binding protein YceI
MIFQPGVFMKSLKQLSLATALFAALAGSAIAAPVTYGVDGSHTFPRFSYSHFGYSTQLSSFKNTTGKVVFDAEAKTGSVDITIDMKSVNTGFEVFDGHIQGEDFFDTAKFPTATFKSTKVVFEGDKPKTVEGNHQGRDQAGDPHRDQLPGHAAPDDEKAGHRCQRLHPRQAFRIQCRQVRALCG